MPIATETGLGVPAHSERPYKPGLYVTAFHGRAAAQEVMQCWGRAGPLIGPLVSCRPANAVSLNLQFKSTEDEAVFFAKVAFPSPHLLCFDEDMLPYNGVLDGDSTLFVAESEECELPADTFRKVLRRESEASQTPWD